MAKKSKPMDTASAPAYSFSVFDNFPNPVWRAGVDAKCDNFNQAWLDFTGRPLAKELGDGWTKGVHPDDLAKCMKGYLAAFKARKAFVLEYRLKHKDKAYHWIVDYGSPVYGADQAFAGYIGSCYDINETRCQQAALEAEREKLETYIEVAGDIIVVLDGQGIVRVVNEAGCRLLGRSKKDVIGKSWFSGFLPVADRAAVKEVFAEFITGKQSVIEHYENKVVVRGGQERLVRWHSAKINNPDGTVSVLSSGRDITEEQQARDSLARLAELNQKIIDKSPIGVFIINQKGMIEYVNQAMLDISATPKDKQLGFNLIESPTYKQIGLDALISRAIKEKKEFTTGLIKYRSLFGKKETYRVFSGIPILDRAGNFEKLILTIKDETEFKRANEDLEKFNRLMVGRELKMVELKNEIAKLRQALAERESSQKPV